MYQVVSELAKGHTKSETPEMLKSLFSKHSGLTRGIVMAVLSMSLAMPVGVAVQADGTAGTSGTMTNTSDTPATDAAANADLSNLTEAGKKVITDNASAIVTSSIGTLSKDGQYIKAADSVSTNLSTLDTQVKSNADAISKETTDRTTADTALSDKIGAFSKDGNYIKAADSVSTNLSNLDTQVKTNADAISTETTNREKAVKDEATARTTAINELETKLTSGGTNSLATKANVNASNIGKNIDTTDATTADEKKQKQEANATLWGEALGLGAIENGDSMLISGGTLYSELRPSADGTYSYISNANTTAVNLIHLDTALNALGVEMLVDSNGNPIQYTSTLYKYFKVNPETTTNDDGTKTYATDAEANGTNSVAIGPNAKTTKYTTTTTSGDTTTTTETAADHAVAIGEGATVNAAGDQGIALGNGAVTGEAETTTSDGTTTTTTDAKGGESSVAIGDTAKANGNQALAFGKGASVLNPSGTAVSTGSTAIGSGAKVDGGDNSIALGTKATVNTVSDAMALGNGATINKTATGSIAFGKSAVTGGVDKPIALTNGTTGTLAAAGGVDSIAIGNGAVSEGNEALALGKGAKVTNGATSGDSAAAIVKTGSAAIGDGATVANSENSMAIGKGASITEGTDTTVIGSGAKASQTKQAFVAGYQASAESSAESSVAIGDNASTHSARTTAIGYKAEAHNADSIAIGSEAKTDDNGGGIAIGTSTSAAYGGLAIGKSANALNDDSLAIGNGAVADVNKSISIGYNAGVGTAEDNKEKNGSLVAIGTSAGNNVKGMQNVAIGASAGSSVLSSNNIAIGTNAGYGIKNVTSTTDTNPQNGYNIAIGADANYVEGNTNQNIVSSIAIGHNTHAVNRAVALGEGASAQGDSGMALGNSATSSGSGSIAIGNIASASNGNIALGAGAIATGTPTGTGKWTNTAAPSYYISVGGKGNASDSTITLRRISNVADGSADQDVVTVKQLQKVSDDLENTIKGIDTSQLKTYSTTEIDNKIAEVNQNIKDSGVKYFSINSASQSTNSNNTGANGDGDADAMAIGPNAKASSVKALAIGNNVSASGTLSIAIGTANNPSTDTTTADNPHPTSSEGTSSVAIGISAIAQTDNSIAIGTRATTYTANTTSSPVTKVGIQSIAIGYGAETRDNNAIAFGTGAKANSAASIAIGDNAQALNENAVVVGTSSTAYGSDSVTLGKSNTNNGKGVMTTGNSNSVTNSQSAADAVQNSGIYGSLNKIQSVSSSNSSNAITDVYAVGNSNTLNQNGEKNVLSDVSLLGNNNTIENGTAGAYTQTVKQIAVVGSGNTVKGNTQVDYNTWGTVQRDTILGYKNTVDATNQSTPVSNLQILGNDVTATLSNSVYLGTGSSATASKSATAEAIQLAKDQGDAEAIASDEYKNATTEAEQTAIKQKYEAKYIHAANIAAMDKDGISAGVINYDKDYTYGNDSSYTYAGSQATGIVTVGSEKATRRIQNVSAGLVGPNSTDAVNGSQLYALTRQIRFGGDNSTFGDAATSDVNVVTKGSNEKLAITGGAEGVSVTTTTDGKSVTIVDGTKITDKNIAVIAENDALHVKLASNLQNLNTASMGKTTTGTAADGSTTTSYQETLKLDGTGDNGGTLTLKDATGANGVTLRTSGTTTTADVTGTKTNRLRVNDTTVATTDDGLKFGGDTGADSALKLNNKLTIKGGADTSKLTENNIGVVSNGSGMLTVKLSKNVNLGTDGSLTTGAVTATTVNATTVQSGDSTLTTGGLSIANGPRVLTSGINAGSKKITDVTAGEANTDAANYGQVKAAKTILTQGNNTHLSDTTADDDGHHIYTVNVDNLSYKAGTDTTAKSITLSNGLTFQNGKNTTAVAGDNGTITYNLNDKIELGAETDSNNHIVVDGTQGLLTLGMNATINGNAGTASIGGVSIGKSGSDQIVTGLSNTTWVVGMTKAVSGRAATEDQLQSVSDAAHTNADNITTLQQGFTVTANNDTEKKSTIKAGDTLNIEAGKNVQISTTADSKSIEVALSDTPEFTTVKTKDTNGNITTVSGTGVTITPTGTGAQSVSLTSKGLDNGNHVIRNVASGGTERTNAANIGDLQDAISNASTTTTNTGFKVKGDDTTSQTVKLGKQLNVVGGTTDSTQLSTGNIGVETTADAEGNATLTVKLKKDIALDSVTTGSTTMNTTGISNGDMSLTNTGMIIKNNDVSKQVSITTSGVSMGSQQVKNVADGTDTKDAVNKGQLDVVQTQVTNGWQIVGSNGQKVADIGAGKKVTFGDTTYATASVQPDGTEGAKVTYTIKTAGLTADTATGKIAEPTTDGVATAVNVANAINNAAWNIKANDGTATAIKAGTTVGLKAGNNLTLSQNGTEFTYKLNKTLMGMTSVTAVDDKQNTAVLNGEGLKVSDKDGNSLTQHATEIRLHDATKAATDTTTDVVLNKQGLQNGGHTITGVANGTVEANSQDAVNGSQLYELQQKITNGWKITGNDTTKASNIGNDKTVSFVNGDNSYIKARVDTTNTGATVSYTAQTASLTKNADGKATLTGTTDGLVTGTNLTSVLNSLSWTAQSSKTGTGQNNGSTTAQSITAGTNVGFIAGDNMILTQDGTNFTYALSSNLTGMNTITFTGLGNGVSNLTIGLQNGGGANPDKGYYITGLSNTKWDQSNYEGSRAATEAQLRDAIDKVSAATGTGGFGLTADEGANNGGEKKVSQTLGRTIAIQGDGTYDAEGKVVKQGNISTVAYTDNAGPTGAIKVKLNKDIDLSKEGSLTIGSSKVSAGSIVLDNTSDAAKKIALNSTAGIASIGGVMVNGAEKTVNGLSNTTWNGTAVSGRAATENQLVDAINEVKKQAANSELHIKKGVYAIGKDSQGQDITDTKGKNSVSIDVVNAQGTVDGQVVINDVAKASELGIVGELADNLKNPAGGSTTVVQAVNKVNQKVDDSLKQVNGDISNAVTEARKHTEVKSVDSDNNVTIDGTTTNADGGTIYKLGLNKNHLNLGNVHVYGNEGRITANTVEAETVKIDDQTRLDKTGLTTGNTTVANNRIVVGGDNGIKIEANGGQQTISGLTNTDWTGTAVHGRAATEDQLAKAISSATTTAAQNEQHIKAGTYDIQTTTDDKGNKQNSVTMKIVDGTGKDKGTVTINDVAKASDVGDTDKLAADIKNQNGGQPQTTSVVEAVNNLNEKVNNRVGDNKYSAITSTDPVQDGDSSTTAIGKLNNRMNDIYTVSTQHSSVSVDENLTMDDTKKNASGGTEYKLGLNKEKIDLGNVTIKGNDGSIEAKSMKADSLTAGSTVVNNDGVKVGDKSSLTGDSLKVNGKTYISSNGINANSQKITNVQTGTADTDAANVGQMREADAQLADAIQQTDAGLNEVGRAVNKLGNRLNRVGAGAAALAALHPGTYDPNDKWDFSAGIGHYHDANAVAIGAYYHPNDTTILSIGGSMGGGENMVNAGITWKMGRSGREQAVQPVVVRKAEAAPVAQAAAPVRPAPVIAPVPVVTPAPVTTPAPVKSVASITPVQAVPAVTTPVTPAAPSNDTAALAQILARQTAILEKLAQNQSQAAPSAAVAHGDDIFPDVPDNHWAYAYVAKLEKAGALKGFKRPAVLKSPMMTRDDFASVLYTAMANGATTNPVLNGDDSLNRLAQEFKAELKNVKV